MAAPEYVIEGYHIRPPAGYSAVQTEAPEGASAYAWVGAQRKDGTRAALMLTLIVDEKAARGLTLEQAAGTMLYAVKKLRVGWTQSPAERVTIDGIAFTRIRWSASERKSKRKMRGFILEGRDGDTLVTLSSQDVLPQAEHALSLAETGAKTFKRPFSRILYSVRWPDHAQIISMNPDGSDRVCLTPLTDSDYYPSISPDGSMVAFTSHRDSIRALYLMDTRGSNQRRLADEGDAGLCAWSPDGTQLAYSSNRNGRYCIYVMQSDGHNVRRLSDGPSDDCPSWSGDGSKIAFQSIQDGKRRIALVGVDGKGLKYITKGRWDDRWPVCSPDGSSIAYTSYEHGNGDIYVMDIEGKEAVQLTSNPREDRQPAWTADSRQILFHSSRAGRFDVYSFDLATKAERRLTTETKDTADVTTLGRHITAGK